MNLAGMQTHVPIVVVCFFLLIVWHELAFAAMRARPARRQVVLGFAFEISWLLSGFERTKK